MSRHEGVSCDSCLKGNFRGKRYKCLVCYDYDLCATCYEAGASTTRHNADHPMQCILTRSDFDLYYGGETASVEHPQSFTCPFCGRMGLTETVLTEHVSAEHSEASTDIVCPVCASQPGGEPNHVTDDFSAHLALDHRNREIDEPTSSRHTRRMPHSGRGMSGGNRTRRNQMNFTSAGGLASLSPNSRDSMDPIAELLSQLSSVRRSNLAQSNTTTQLQQLQMQLQMERQQAQMARQQLERLPRRQPCTSSMTTATGNSTGALQTHFTVSLEPSSSPSSTASGPQFLLARCTDPVITEGEQAALEAEHAERSFFVQELLLNTLGEQFNTEELDSLVRVIDLNSSSNAAAPASSYPDVNDNHGPRRDNTPTAIPPAPQQPPPPQQDENRQQQPPRVLDSNRPRSYNNRAGAGSNPPSGGGGGRGGGAPQRQVPLGGGGSATNRPVNNRTANRASSPTRRKGLRQVDDRNKTADPPPPH